MCDKGPLRYEYRPPSGLRRDKGNDCAFMPAIDAKILAVQSEDQTIGDLLSHGYDTSIREVHRLVGIFAHEPNDTVRVGLHGKAYLPTTVPGQLDHARRVFSIVGQPRARLRENRFAGAQPGKAPELINRPVMMYFPIVQKGYDRAGVNEHAFCHTA